MTREPLRVEGPLSMQFQFTPDQARALADSPRGRGLRRRDVLGLGGAALLCGAVGGGLVARFLRADTIEAGSSGTDAAPAASTLMRRLDTGDDDQLWGWHAVATGELLLALESRAPTEWTPETKRVATRLLTLARTRTPDRSSARLLQQLAERMQRDDDALPPDVRAALHALEDGR